MVKRSLAILMGTAVPLFIIFISALLGLLGPGLVLALLITFRLVFQSNHFARVMQISRSEALIYSLYLAFCIYPQFLGVIDSLRQFRKERVRLNRMKHAEDNSSLNAAIQTN